MNRPQLISVALANLVLTASLSACPFCRVSGDDLGTSNATREASNNDSTTQATATETPRPLRFGLAFDVASANFHHGYMLQDSGLVFQPTLSISPQPLISGDWRIEPYLVWINTMHTDDSPGYAGGHGGHTRTEQQYQQYLDQPHAGNPLPHFHTRLVDVISYEDAGGGWFESEIRPGIRFANGPLALDLALKAHFYPSDFHDFILEASAKLTYDLTSLWTDEAHPLFALRAIGTISHELRDDNGDENTVIEAGLEPIWRFNLGSKRASIAFPVMLGMSPNGYYLDSDTSDAFLGYLSASAELTVPLPVNEKYGKWYFNAGVTGYQMLADSAEFANNGEQGLQTHIGLGIAF